MNRILNILINPGVVKAIVFLALIVIIFFFINVALITRILLIMGVLLIWLLIYLSEKQQATKSGAAIEQALWTQADEQLMNVKTRDKADIEDIKQKFQDAVNVLKSSTLGKGKSGNSALYTLPWYMIVGPSAAGKTTAIRESDVDSPVIDPITGKKQEIKGVGGTLNCDWWFMNEAVLLDTAGRWISGAEEKDKEEWLSFLTFLKKYRRKKPINGVIVAISIADFNDYDERQIDDEASKIRNRIDELIKELGILFPVYLLFTKCDLVSGFVEMFGNMSKAKRNQTWGHTISLDDSRSMSPITIFNDGMQELSNSLNRYRFSRMQEIGKEAKRKKVFSFPLQFTKIESKLSQFVGRLFRENTYLGTPMFRGFYFTSGTQEGDPIDSIFDPSLFPGGFRAEEMYEPVDPKSYFITNLFSKVIVPDKNLAGITPGERKKRLFSTVGVFAVVGVALVLFTLAVMNSYRLNKRYLNTINNAAVVTAQIPINPNRGRAATFKKHLNALNDLRIEMDKKPSFWRSFGLGIKRDVNLKAQQLYFNKSENCFTILAN